MLSFKQEILSENFYGKKSVIQQRIEDIIEKESKEKEEVKIIRPKFMHQLLGPSQTWKVFQKQQDAIAFCFQRRNGLMCFAFEDINARRMFLVAHPKVFWYLNHQRFFKNCNTYEIIQEYAACKLYFDIEYDFKFNCDHNPQRMVKNFLQIININLKKYYGLNIEENNILKLDSTSSVKFSHHIIYPIKNIAFQNNYVVGYFLKRICNELKEAYKSSLAGDCDKLSAVCKTYGLSSNDIIELFISKENQKNITLFVDEGVYTKNRHFRLLGSSKQHKNIPFVPSKENEYKPDINSEDYEDCCFFLDSLITYFSWPVTKILDFEVPHSEVKKTFVTVGQNKDSRSKNSVEEKKKATDMNPAFHRIDDFIRSLVFPAGKIRQKAYFADTFTIVYEIQGFRYCENIGREHKSNNIKYVVDLQLLAFYQKCYDPDCADFRSNYRPLPEEIKFYFEDDTEFNSMIVENTWQKLNENLFPQTFANPKAKVTENKFFQLDEDVTEEELEKVADYAEALLDVKW